MVLKRFEKILKEDAEKMLDVRKHANYT